MPSVRTLASDEADRLIAFARTKGDWSLIAPRLVELEAEAKKQRVVIAQDQAMRSSWAAQGICISRDTYPLNI